MTLQSGRNVQVAFKRQPALGTPASGANAIGLNLSPNGTQSLKLTKATIPSTAIRRDGQTKRGRHGSRSAGAVWAIELGVGAVDDLLEAMLHTTVRASTDIDEGDFTSITTTATTIVFTSGSPQALGIRRGDMIQLTGHSTASNNGKWIPVLAASSTTITVAAGFLTLNAVADTAVTITIAKTFESDATPDEYYYTLEEFGLDIAKGLIGTDCKVTRMEISAQPDQNIIITFTFVGLDVAKQETDPNFTDPDYSTAIELVLGDGYALIAGSDKTTVLTALSLVYDRNGSVTPTLAQTSPDVNTGLSTLSGNFTAMREDMDFFDKFDQETTTDLFIVLQEKTTDPKPFISFYAGNIVLDSADPTIGGDGTMPETVNFRGGVDLAGGDHAPTTLKIATSAA